IAVMRGVGEWQADPEVLRPISPLHAKRRIERVRQALDRQIERTVAIDDVEIGREVETLDLDIESNAPQRVAKKIGEARRQERILRQPELGANAAGAARQARLVQQTLRRLEVDGPSLDLGIVEFRQ